MIRDPSPRAQGITVLSDDSGLFTGRAAALAEISAWLDNPRAAATLVLTGASGSGKSALLAHVWARWAGGRPAWSHGGRAAVAGEVAHRVAGRRSAAVTPAGPGPGVQVAIDAYGRTTSDVLATLCAAVGCTGTRPADLLAATRRRSDPLVALVDGVDSACDPEHLVTTLLGPLSRATDGDHLRLLVCSRPASLESLIGDARIVDLDRPEYSAPEDMRTYTIRCLTEMADWSPYRLASAALLAQVVDIVLAAAGPSFLVALIVARNLANRPAPVNPSDPLWRVSLPTTPAAAVAWDLATRLGPQDARKAEDLLVPLAYARGAGLPWDDVWADVASSASGRSYTDEDVSWLRRAVGWYVLEVADAGRLVYRPAYRAVTDHLRAGRDDRTVHAAFTSVLAEGVRIGMHGTPEWSDVSSYTSTHIATHAAAAGLLDHLLCDPHFLLAADRARLLAALPSATSAQGRAAADAYRTCPPPADEARWLAELDIAAHCARATTLAAAFDRLRTPRPWAVRWAHWSAPRPCRTMAGGHVGAILSAATLRLGDTRLAVTGGDDGTVRVWDIAAGRPIGPPLVGAGGPVHALAATVLDGRATAIAAGRGEGGIVRRWDLMADVATPVQTPTTADVTAVALTQVGGATWAITGGSDGSLATWDLASGRPVLPAIRAHDHEIRSIVVTSFGAWVLAVTTATDRTACAWVLGTGQPDGQPLVGRPGGIGAAAIVPWHGRAIAVTADATGTLDLWDLAVARHAGALMPGSAGVVDVMAATAIDTRPVAVTGSPDGVVRVWDLASGQPAYAPLTGHKARITAVAVDNGKPPIAVSACAEGVVRVWDLTTEEIPDVGATHTTDVSAMTADESRVVVATSDGGVHVMDMAAGKPFGPAIPVHPYGVTAVTTADVHGFHVLLTGAADGRVRRWDPVTGELIGRPLVGNGRPVRALAAISFADRTIALAVDGDGHVEMWDLETGELLPPLPAHHSGETTAVAAAALDRGLAVVTGYADGTITVNPATGSQRAAVIAGRGAPVTALATASVGSHLLVLSSDTDRKARIWDVDPHDGSRRFGRRFRTTEETSLDCVPSCAALRLARTGMPIAVFGAGEDVRLWRARTAVTGLRLQAPVTALTFGDDNVLLIGTERGLICLAL